MVVSKHLTHFCYLIRQVLYQYLNSYLAYPSIPPKNSNHAREQHEHLPTYFVRLLQSNFDKTSTPKRGFFTSITLEIYFAQPHCVRITKHGYQL